MGRKLRVPKWVKKHDVSYPSFSSVPDSKLEEIRNGLKRFDTPNPEISIVIPAYNEEQDILKTLSSLSENQIEIPTELIVVNNNSTDATQEILDALGVKSVFETNQGISHARQAGLEAARGEFIVCADADTIYPPYYGSAYYRVLKSNSDVACVYGKYSFIPSEGNSRNALAVHEFFSDFAFKMRRNREEAINVMGFTFGFRKKDGMEIGGFKHDLNRKVTGRSEDGWMALELKQKGSIYRVDDSENLVWTSDRRLLESGSMFKAFKMRLLKELNSLGKS